MSIEQIKIWIKAARLRTLPLSISGIVAGNAFDKYVVVSPFNNAFLFVNKNSS